MHRLAPSRPFPALRSPRLELLDAPLAPPPQHLVVRRVLAGPLARAALAAVAPRGIRPAIALRARQCQLHGALEVARALAALLALERLRVRDDALGAGHRVPVVRRRQVVLAGLARVRGRAVLAVAGRRVALVVFFVVVEGPACALGAGSAVHARFARLRGRAQRGLGLVACGEGRRFGEDVAGVVFGVRGARAARVARHERVVLVDGRVGCHDAGGSV